MSGWATFTQALSPALGVFQQNGWTTALVGMGKGILAVAVVLELASDLLDYWTRGNAQELIGKVFRMLVVTSIPMMMLTNWTGGLTADINGFFANDLPNALGVGQNLDAGISSISTAYGQVVHILWDGPASPVGDSGVQAAAQAAGAGAPPPAGGAGASGSGSFLSNLLPGQSFGSTLGSLWTTMKDLPGTVVYLFISLYAVIAMTLCMVIFTMAVIFALYGPIFVINVGMVFGPILVAFLPWRPMRNAFVRWLDFMMMGGGAYVIGMMFGQIGATAMTGFASTIQEIFVGSGGSHMAAAAAVAAGTFPIMVTMLFLAMMMLRIEKISSALFGGVAIEGGGAFAGTLAGNAMRKPITGSAGAGKRMWDSVKDLAQNGLSAGEPTERTERMASAGHSAGSAMAGPLSAMGAAAGGSSSSASSLPPFKSGGGGATSQ